MEAPKLGVPRKSYADLLVEMIHRLVVAASVDPSAAKEWNRCSDKPALHFAQYGEHVP